jgi:hypothetical protein
LVGSEIKGLRLLVATLLFLPFVRCPFGARYAIGGRAKRLGHPGGAVTPNAYFAGTAQLRGARSRPYSRSTFYSPLPGRRRLCCIVQRIARGVIMTADRILKWTFLFVGAFAVGDVFADQWSPASTKQYVSDDGAWRLTVEPRAITSPLDYFEEQEDGKAQPGGVPGSSQASAMGTMERRVEGAWHRVWQRPLRNDVAPVDAVALPGGAAMTLDNWHSMGYGKDAVVLYDAQGAAQAAYALTDFLPADYVRALPRTVSSVHWRGEAKALPDGKRVSVPVFVPSPDNDGLPNNKSAQFVQVVFDLAAGKVEPPAGPAWEHAEQTARQVRAKQLEAEAEERRRFIEPLTVPQSADEREWHQYLVEAFFRLDPASSDEYPATTVLRSPSARDYQASVAWVHGALRGEDSEGAIMLASPSQDALLARIEAEAKGMPAGALSLARVYLLLNGARFVQAQSALAHSGADLIQLDPATAIPQRPDRLEYFMKMQEETDE